MNNYYDELLEIKDNFKNFTDDQIMSEAERRGLFKKPGKKIREYELGTFGVWKGKREKE